MSEHSTFSLKTLYLPENQPASMEYIGFRLLVHADLERNPYEYLGLLARTEDGQIFCDARPAGDYQVDANGFPLKKDFLELDGATLSSIVDAIMHEMSTGCMSVDCLSVDNDHFSEVFAGP
jgi:hypothetical protein